MHAFDDEVAGGMGRRWTDGTGRDGGSGHTRTYVYTKNKRPLSSYVVIVYAMLYVCTAKPIYTLAWLFHAHHVHVLDGWMDGRRPMHITRASCTCRGHTRMEPYCFTLRQNAFMLYVRSCLVQKKITKFFRSPSHRIFRRVHGALNIDENKN